MEQDESFSEHLNRYAVIYLNMQQFLIEKVNTRSFKNDMRTFETKDDVLTLLVHLGYLAYDSGNREAFIPNKEIVEEFENAMGVGGWPEVMRVLKASQKLPEATVNGEAQRVAEALDRAHTDNPALIIELKYDKSAATALQQIKDRKYTQALERYRGEIVLVGVDYDRDRVDKPHGLNTIFLGIPFLTFYQLFSGALRSRGNSRIPLLAMTISSLCNIVLDVLFVNVLEFGIAGAALGTILSEFLVMLICGYYFYNEKKKIKYDNSYVLNQKTVMAKLFRVGFPMAMQSFITSIGGLIVVSRINQYEISFLAGYTSAVKLYGLLEIAASSFGMAAAAYVSQNYGANKIVRIKQGVRASTIMGTAVSLICSGIMVFGGKTILRLFIDNSVMMGQILGYGYQFLQILAFFFPFLYILYILRAVLQGMNNTVVPMLSSFAQLTMRLLCATVLTKFIGCEAIFWGEILAWLFADAILFVTYKLNMKRIENR